MEEVNRGLGWALFGNFGKTVAGEGPDWEVGRAERRGFRNGNMVGDRCGFVDVCGIFSKISKGKFLWKLF